MQRPWRTWFVWLLLAVNVFGAIYGFWWYRAQLEVTPTELWFFTADCPVYGALFAGILVLWLLKKSIPQWFYLLTVMGLIKYGLWFTMVVILHWLDGGNVHIVNWLLIIPHLGMALQGAVFLRQRQFSLGAGVINLVWMLVNDLVDYGLGVHPWLFRGMDVVMVRNFTLGLSLALGLGIIGVTLSGSLVKRRDWVA